MIQTHMKTGTPVRLALFHLLLSPLPFILLAILSLGLGGCLGCCLGCCLCCRCLLSQFLGLTLLVRMVRLPVVLRHMVKIGIVTSGDVPWRARAQEPVIESYVSQSDMSPNIVFSRQDIREMDGIAPPTPPSHVGNSLCLAFSFSLSCP